MIDEADRLRDRRDWSAAASAYEAVLLLDATIVPIWIQLGHARKEAGNYSGAEAAYLRAWELGPDQAETALQIGHLFNRRKQAGDPLKWYEIAALLDPKNPDVARHLADAQEAAQKVLEEALLDLANGKMRSGDYVEACALFQRLIVEFSRRDIYLLFGHSLKECGRFVESADAYHQYRNFIAVYDKTQLPEYYIQLGHLCKVQRKHHEALSHYIEAKLLLSGQFGCDPVIRELEAEISACACLLFPNLF